MDTPLDISLNVGNRAHNDATSKKNVMPLKCINTKACFQNVSSKKYIYLYSSVGSKSKKSEEILKSTDT